MSRLEKVEKIFIFQGKEYTYMKLKGLELIKTFIESSHLDRKLLRDNENGFLFLYEFYEWEDWNGGNDEIYETFALVKDETDAVRLNKEQPIRRSPYIYVSNDYDIVVG